MAYDDIKFSIKTWLLWICKVRVVVVHIYSGCGEDGNNEESLLMP